MMCVTGWKIRLLPEVSRVPTVGSWCTQIINRTTSPNATRVSTPLLRICTVVQHYFLLLRLLLRVLLRLLLLWCLLCSSISTFTNGSAHPAPHPAPARQPLVPGPARSPLSPIPHSPTHAVHMWACIYRIYRLPQHPRLHHSSSASPPHSPLPIRSVGRRRSPTRSAHSARPPRLAHKVHDVHCLASSGSRTLLSAV